MGVRAVVTAGWAVNDEAANTFAASFYTKLLDEGLPFGHAVFQARRETHERHPNCNTWGAYQAYGDPGFVVDPAGGPGGIDGGVAAGHTAGIDRRTARAAH